MRPIHYAASLLNNEPFEPVFEIEDNKSAYRENNYYAWETNGSAGSSFGLKFLGGLKKGIEIIQNYRKMGKLGVS